VRACWFCGIILSLGSVLVAAQQTIRLHRLSCHQLANTNIRRLLRQKRPCPKTGSVLPRKAHVYIWQMSVLFLALSVVAMMDGIFILLWSGTGPLFPLGEWWTNEAKLAVTFTIVTIAVAVMFVFGQVTMYSWQGHDDSDPRFSEGETPDLLDE